MTHFGINGVKILKNWAVQTHEISRGKLNHPLVIDHNNKRAEVYIPHQMLFICCLFCLPLEGHFFTLSVLGVAHLNVRTLTVRTPEHLTAS